MLHDEIITEAKEALLQSPLSSAVYIGCDSIRFKRQDRYFAKYTTVVVIHLGSKHGCQLFYSSETLPDYGNLKQRLITEVTFAVTAALEFVDLLDGRPMEVHLDINSNPKHKSNIAVKEALGYVAGMGLNAKIKPHSFAASCAADHMVKR